ncbi:MAG: hypothetical protein IPP74_00785 [Alphaproteobacteria bacterium]|nr:hypothetical protein [Alphaproteobacteria bacterium]
MTKSELPSTLVRVVTGDVDLTTLGAPGAIDFFVTTPESIVEMNSLEISKALAIPESSTGYTIIEFSAPKSGIASPVFRSNPGFVGKGITAGGASEFVIPNQPIPLGAIIRKVR